VFVHWENRIFNQPTSATVRRDGVLSACGQRVIVPTATGNAKD
jgi:hypothetical protein